MKQAVRPVIGVTSEENSNPARPWAPSKYGHSRTYIDAIIAAGGSPLILPITDDETVLRPLYEQLDGLCMTGGYDLGTNPTQDATDTTLLGWALQDKLPILAICRGMQLINTSLGGTLIQDIPTDKPDAIDHEASTKKQNIEDLSHVLRIDPASRLAAIIGPEPIGANAHHHQAIATPGRGITATAWASDGIIEAIELAEHPYIIGIQAHPESLTRVEPRWAQLFTSFVMAARR